MAKKYLIFKTIHERADWISDLMREDFDTVSGPELWVWLRQYWNLLYGERELGRPWDKQRLAGIELDTPDLREKFKEIQTTTKKCLKQWLSFRNGEREELPGLKLHYKLRWDKEKNTTWLESVGKKGEVSLIRLEIYEFILKLGINAIRQCEFKECQTLFVTSRKKKKFCHQNCAYKHHYRTRDPENHKKTQKRYYDNRVRSKPGMENAVIAGRRKGE